MKAEIVFDDIPAFTARANELTKAVQRAALEKVAEIARARVAVETGATRDSIQVNEEGMESRRGRRLSTWSTGRATWRQSRFLESRRKRSRLPSLRKSPLRSVALECERRGAVALVDSTHARPRVRPSQ